MSRKLAIVPEPSVIAADPAYIGKEVLECERAGVTMLHVDVMDGHFVPNLTYGPAIVSAIRGVVPTMEIDVHLMMYAPFDWIERFAAAGANHITFHIEATEDVRDTIDFIKKCNMTAGLALCPETSESLVLPYLGAVERILIMTVQPGFGGQEFMSDMLRKIEFLHKQCQQLGLAIELQVDGGINKVTAKKCVDVGATHLVSGTAFFHQKDYAKAYKELLEL